MVVVGLVVVVVVGLVTTVVVVVVVVVAAPSTHFPLTKICPNLAEHSLQATVPSLKV